MKGQKKLAIHAAIVLLAFALMAGCGQQAAAPLPDAKEAASSVQEAKDAVVEPNGNREEDFDYLPQQRALAVLWQQESGEAKALRYQAYHAATSYLGQLVESGLSGNEAVILDIDETVLDNVPFAAQLVYSNLNYSSDLWTEWVLKAEAEPIEGAVQFIRYAQDQGFTVFLVSNRKEEPHGDATEQNLLRAGIEVPRANQLLRTDESDKQPRFDQIAASHKIVMYVGDNLIDFPHGYHKMSNVERSGIVTANQDEFGTVCIVLPNPMNGDFEAALVGYNQARPSGDILAERRQALKPFQ